MNFRLSSKITEAKMTIKNRNHKIPNTKDEIEIDYRSTLGPFVSFIEEASKLGNPKLTPASFRNLEIYKMYYKLCSTIVAV